MNEEILNAFIENEVDAESIDKEREQEVSFNLFILNELAVCKEKSINGGVGGGVEPPSQVRRLYIQFEMAPKLKCHVFDPSSLICDRLAYKNFLIQVENSVLVYISIYA